MKEQVFWPMSGWLPLVVCLTLIVAMPVLIVLGVTLIDRGNSAGGWMLAGGVVLGLAGLLMLFGFQAIPPNDARVMLLFGDYRGSVTESGFFWVNPFYSKRKITLRVRNFETGSITTPETKDAAGKVVQRKSRSAGRPSKVNDRDGNPIDISAIVVLRVVNTAEAMFEVDDYEDFVAVQSEAALRNLASRHPYDGHDDDLSLRGNIQEICDQLRHDIQERLVKAGVEVIEDEERKAAMVSNLLVVLCSDRHTQPVINTGSLYH